MAVSPEHIDKQLKDMYEEVQGMLKQLREFQDEKSKHIQSRHQLGAQKNENDLVRAELNHLESDAAVYKLIGPALVAQDASDAKTIVEKRLEFIGKELTRVDESIKSTEMKEDQMRGRIVQIQNKMTAHYQAQQKAAEAKKQAQ